MVAVLVDRVDELLSTYARHNEEQHRNIAKAICQRI